MVGTKKEPESRLRVRSHRPNPADYSGGVELSEEFEELITKFKGLVGLIAEKSDEETFKEAYSKVFSPNVQRVDEDGTVDGYDKMLDTYLYWLGRNFDVKLLNLKYDPDGTFRCILRGDQSNEEVVMRITCHVEGGFIVKAVVDGRDQRQKVSGQETASNTVRVKGFPTEEELSKLIKVPPKETRGKLLVDSKSTQIAPVRELYEIVKISMQANVSFSAMLSMDMKISLRDSANKEYAGGAYFQRTSLAMPLIAKVSQLNLMDSNSNAQALCVRDDTLFQFTKTYTIYSRIRLHSRDGPMKMVYGVDYFPWLRIVDNVRLPYRPIFCWDGQSFAPFLRARTDGAASAGTFTNAPGLLGKEGFLISDSDVDSHFAFMKVIEHGWELTVAPGVDTSMMLCIAAVLGDIVHVWR